MTSSVLYLPLTIEQARGLIDSSTKEELFLTLGSPQLAVIAVIQSLPALLNKPANQARVEGEKALAELISVGRDLDQTQPQGTFVRLISSRFNSNKFEEGLTYLPMLGIYLLDEDTVEAADYLSDGLWDFEFGTRHTQNLNPLKFEFKDQFGKSFSLSDQQSRTFRVIQAEPDESIHIQGLAGTGKTHMINRLVASLSHCKPLILAFTKPQLDILMSRLGGTPTHLTGMTFGELADYVLRREMPHYRTGKRISPLYRIAPAIVANQLGYKPVGTFTPAQVASLCYRMIASFCNGTDRILTKQHIPNGLTFNPVESAVLVEYAQRQWDETIAPTNLNNPLPLRGYHRIKHMSLLPEATIGSEFTHIIVDEAHDLSRPLATFLDSSHQPVITLGDAFQRLDGLHVPRSGWLRNHELNHSIRAGRRIEEVLNPLIEHHPVLQLDSMHGNDSIDTKVIYYDKPDIPYGAATILVESEWGLFEWFQRLSSAGAKFSLLNGAASTFRRFIIGCIELFHDGVRPQHGALFKYSHWDDLSREMRSNPSFERIERMLSKGYSTVDFETSLLNLDESGTAKIRLGRVSDARNMELDSVMLAPELLNQAGRSNPVSASKAFSALYTGGSRARHELMVPGYLRDWASDISATVKKRT